MERITYRITLDAHKIGIQRRLQGFMVGDNLSRRLVVGIVASGDTVEIPTDHVTAMMYVMKPSDESPSINECTIEDNTIIYDILPTDLAEEGIVEMQLKLIETSLDGARSVLLSPRFTLEVAESGANDEAVEKTTTFTALENAIAQARTVYDTRILRVEIDEDCTFRVTYADGTVYENDYFKDALYNGNAILSQSFAVGGTGTRDGEDADNSKYYKEMAEAVLAQSLDINEQCIALRDEMVQNSIYTTFTLDFETGCLTYQSQTYSFTIDENGNLEYEAIN